MGLKQEAMDIIEKAVQGASTGQDYDSTAPHPFLNETDDVSTDNEEREYRDTMKRLGITDQNRIKEESDIGRQTPIESQNASHQPEMIILQVAGESVEIVEDPRKSRSRSRGRSGNSERPNKLRPSRTVSRDSGHTGHSRINTAENIIATEDGDYKMYNKRGSEGTHSLETAMGTGPHKFVVM